ISSKIVTEKSRPALELVSRLRIPTPRDLVLHLSSHESVEEAERIGLLYHIDDIRRPDLVGLLATLRVTTISDELVEIDDEFNDDSEPGLVLSIAEQELH